jgi:hypothetical protein
VTKKKENGEGFILEKFLKIIVAGTGHARVNILYSYTGWESLGE